MVPDTLVWSPEHASPESGNQVTCVDIDQKKIDNLNKGIIPIYEPGLSELVVRNATAGRLHFTTELESAVKNARVLYLAVGTPQGDDGSADLSALLVGCRFDRGTRS